MKNENPRIIHAHGGYRKLIVYDKSDMICQATQLFCRRFKPKYGDRTVDQMVQAARSCKQNIVEGSEAAATSLETQIKLTNVARASLAELLQDYEDHLKFRGLPIWGAEHPSFSRLRDFSKKHAKWEDWADILEGCSEEKFCNALITVVSQAMYLLKGLVEAQESDFRENGGIRERMTAVRLGRRTTQNEEIAALKAENASLREEIAALRAENERLRAALVRGMGGVG